MPGLYDAYQLANSNQVQQYQGSAMPDMMKVADVMQNRYDLAEQGMQGLGDAVKNGRGAVLQGDQELYDQRSKFYNDQIKQYASRPDLENVAKQVVRMGRNWGNEYSNFTSRVGQYQGYRAELDKAVDKGHIDQGTADSLLGMATDQSGKMTYNPQTGQYDNVRFNGIIPAHRVDINEWTKKAAGDIVGQTVESVNKTEQGDYLVKTTQGYTRLPAEKIEQYMQKAYQLDPEIQADFNQRAKIASWKAKNIGMKFSDIPDQVTVTDPKTGKQIKVANTLKQEVQDAADKQGIHPDSLVPNYVHEATMRQSQGDLFGYGTKYSKNDWHGGTEIDGESVAGKRKETGLDDSRFTLMGNILNFAEHPHDPDEVAKGASDADASVADIQKRLDNAHNLTDNERTDLQDQLANAKTRKMSYESIMTGAKDDAARQMGYKDYGEYMQKRGGDYNRLNKIYTENAPKTYSTSGPGGLPSGSIYDKGMILQDANGNKVTVTKDEVIKAAKEGKISTGADGGWGSNATVSIPGKGVLQAPSGIQVKLLRNLASLGDADFDSRYKGIIKDGAKNYGVQVAETQLLPKESEGLKTVIQSDPSAINWKDPNNIGGDNVEAPKDFNLGSIKIVNHAGKYYLSANELSTDKATKGAPTGKTYIAEVPAGSTVGPAIAKNMLMKNGDPRKINSDPNMLAQASVLMGNNLTGMIGELENNQSMIVPSRTGNKVATVQRKSLNTSGKIVYDVYDENGKLVNAALDNIDPTLRTDVDKLGIYLKRAQEHDEKSQKK